jgi:uncharacterized membrane protein
MSHKSYLMLNLLLSIVAMLIVQWIFQWDQSWRMWATYFVVTLWNLLGFVEGQARR